MLDSLRTQLPGLSAATGCRVIDWATVEAGIGSPLPSDYKVLAEAFPSFAVDEFLLVSTPRPGDESDFVVGVTSARELLEDEVSEDDIPAEYLVAGDDGQMAALLPCGGTPDGDEIFWNTAAEDPDSWPVVFRSRGGGWWTVQEGIVGFLEGIFSGRVVVPGLPPSFRETARQVSFLSW
ncbi:hypothetical protein [Kitasatospora indigofera]|uniref:hypothetical protein n=1 Tax=Kitasatospora indigofera TaxID=67307 RepID=UPI0036C74C1C